MENTELVLEREMYFNELWYSIWISFREFEYKSLNEFYHILWEGKAEPQRIIKRVKLSEDRLPEPPLALFPEENQTVWDLSLLTLSETSLCLRFWFE